MAKLVCSCAQVCEKQLSHSIQTGQKTFEQLQNSIGVASICGACSHTVKKILKEKTCSV